jgi:NMD protein affecting ribosome stability and mRNA decay
MHEGVACTQCHTKMVFTNVGTKCSDCHADIHRGQMSTRCEQCHSVKGWNVTVQAIQNHNNRFPLLGAHAAVECDSCHKNAAAGQFQGLSTDCYSCHLKQFQQTTNPKHTASTAFNKPCEQCHSVDTWLNAKFDHATTGFPLTGGHAAVACEQCHVNGNYNLTSTACNSCHMKDFQATNNPSHVTAKFSTTCEQCHTTATWLNATFDHSTTGFILTGGHAMPPRQCADCHINNNYNMTTAACVSCHLKDFQGTTNPNHVTGGFSQACETCHNVNTWQGATFDHASTGFALTGVHATTACAACHVNNNYSITDKTCVSCHLKDFQGAKTPDHVASNFPQTCEQCHSTTSWMGGTFDHATTGFALTGLHTVPPRACTDCHVNNNYSITNTACVSCHLTDFQGAKSPDHVASNFSQTCQQCHGTSSWMGAQFDHATTGFALTGLHMVPPRACTDCHVNNNYNITTAACVSCHLTDFQGAKTPDHVASNFPQTCQQCHGTSSWQGASFDHATTGFALTGLHTVPPRACTDCHVNNNYNITNTACVSCHLTDFQGAKSPDHVASNFSQTCQQCHTTTSWLGAAFDHSTTGFALTGLHTVPPRACTDCHVNNNYNITVTTCVSCHLNDYNTATTPVNHKTAGFPTTCESCHDTVVWTNGKFDHSTTGFALLGAHTVPPRTCTECHVNNNYNITNTTCVSCHLNDYNTATAPVNHIQVGFPTTCEVCHDTVLWTNGRFDHNTTAFPLTGKHTTTPCASCHVNNNYTTVPTDCYSCHKTDYTGTTNPNHQAAGFPTTCATCHNTTDWTQATFNHTWFPTNHGNANGVCATCHQNSSDYTIFQCTNCHGGGNSNNFRHPNVNGYVYNSINCYQCHRNGRGG